jgi:hypothetical protein
LPAAPALFAAPPPSDLRRPLVGAGALVGLVAVRRLLSRTRPLVTAADGAGESVGAAPRDRCGADQERR